LSWIKVNQGDRRYKFEASVPSHGGLPIFNTWWN